MKASTPIFLCLSLLLTLVSVGGSVDDVDKFADVSHNFTSKYKLDVACPDSIEIMQKPTVDKFVGKVNFSDIKEDGNTCKGAGSPFLKFVSSTSFKSPDLPRILEYPEAYEAIKANFERLVVGNKSTAVLAFAELPRVCGNMTYSNNTSWFFINASSDFEIRLTGSKSALIPKIVTIPKRTRSLLIQDGTKACLLVDDEVANTTALDVNTRPPASGDVVHIDSSPYASAQPFAGFSGNTCFPETSTVELENGTSVGISDLQIGDRVRTGSTSFSTIFMFSHRDPSLFSSFLTIRTASRNQITLTPSHYIYSNAGLVPAESVKVGDDVKLGNGLSSKVTSVELVDAKGLYNPHTINGNIVVDGIQASTYTTSVDPRIAHGLLLGPLRFLYAVVGAPDFLDYIGTSIGYHANFLALLVPNGPNRIA